MRLALGPLGIIHAVTIAYARCAVFLQTGESAGYLRAVPAPDRPRSDQVRPPDRVEEAALDVLGLDQDEMFRVAIDEFVALVLTRMNTPGSAPETAA